YRITLNRDASTWGGGNFVVRTPLIENVRSLTFRYSGMAGPLNGAFDLSSVAEDIGGDDALAARRLRSQIRRIQVDVEGLTRDPDLGWEDPGDTNPATRPYRKFHLRGTLTPRNLGRRGLPDVEWGNP
ncbi:MAG: hypothetical protein ACREDF_05325, partial [Thermoplasmata archaeon]